MFFLWHAFCPASRFWVWDAKGWRCSSCRYLVRADSRDASWRGLSQHHTTDLRITGFPAGPQPSEMPATGEEFAERFSDTGLIDGS